MAISVPLPTETPISAFTKLMLSLMPSPHIMTNPFSFSFVISSAFCFGTTPAMTFSIPIVSPIAFAVFSLSPVSITGDMFCCFNLSITSFAFSFIISFTPIKAIKVCSFATNKILFPSFSNISSSLISFSFIVLSILTLFSNISFLFPIR